MQEAKDTKAIECKIFNSYNGTGIAILTSTYRIFVINNVDDPRVRKMAEVPGLFQKKNNKWQKLLLFLNSQCQQAENENLDPYFNVWLKKHKKLILELCVYAHNVKTFGACLNKN